MNELPDDEYRHIVQTLNKEQKEFFYHVIHLIKTSEEPFYCFLRGVFKTRNGEIAKWRNDEMAKWRNGTKDKSHSYKVWAA